MDNDRDAAGGQSRRRVRSWDAPLLVALASVFVALIYNGVQASNTATQLEQGQETLELSRQSEVFATFMEMHDRIVRADAETNKAAAALDIERSDLNRIRLLNAITPLEGVVFALESDVLPAGTRRVWAKFLTCDYQLVEGSPLGGFALDDWVPTLGQFAESHAVPTQRCPVRP